LLTGSQQAMAKNVAASVVPLRSRWTVAMGSRLG
jgi:hypothetical protein